MGFKDYIQRKGIEWFYPDYFTPEVAPVIHGTLQHSEDGDFKIQVDPTTGRHPFTPKPRVSLKSAAGLRDAYDACSVVSTIVSRVASAVINGRLVIRDKKSLQEVKYGYSRVLDILNRPNSYQTYTEFIIDLEITKSLFGLAVVYAPKTIGFSIPEALHVVDPDKVKVKYKETNSLSSVMNREAETVYVTINSKEYAAYPGDIHYYYDVVKAALHQPEYGSNGLQTKGPVIYRSRLRPLRYEVENIIQAQEAIYSLNKDRGAQGILSNDKKDAAGYLPLTVEEKEQLDRAYRRKYGMNAEDDKIILTDASVKWQQISFSVKDLMLFEGIKSNMCSIADAYNYPFELLANDKGSTFSNKDAAKKYLYQDNIIPETIRLSEFLASIIKLRGSDEFYFDFSHLEVLQEANKDEAIALRSTAQAMHVLYQNGVITKEEFRRACGLEDEVYGETYIDPTLLTATNSITNQSPAGTGYDNNDADNYE